MHVLKMVVFLAIMSWAIEFAVTVCSGYDNENAWCDMEYAGETDHMIILGPEIHPKTKVAYRRIEPVHCLNDVSLIEKGDLDEWWDVLLLAVRKNQTFKHDIILRLTTGSPLKRGKLIKIKKDITRVVKELKLKNGIEVTVNAADGKELLSWTDFK